MHFFSYRNREALKRIAVVLGIIVAAALVIWLFALSYMDRYIVYERDGAHLETGWADRIVDSGEKQLMSTEATVTELEPTTTGSGSVRQLSGIYVSLEMLKNLDTVRNTIIEGDYQTILIEVKAVSGNFYYNTSIDGAPLATTVDTTAVTEFIQEMKARGCYMIASIPAFADRAYCLNHTDLGLPLRAGYLWTDEYNCYWLNPAKDGTIEYIETVCRELSSMGFQEILLRNFYFPDDDTIVFDSTTTVDAAMASFVTMLQAEMNTEDVAVSFGVNTSYGFPTTISSGRLYLTTSDGANVSTMVEKFRENVMSAETQLVFIADSKDTRFDDYGHLIPAISGTAD